MPHTIEIPEAARLAIREGRKIEAIKIVREQLGLGLAEAKAVVERVEQGADPRLRDAAPSPDGTFPLAAVVALRKGHKIGAIKIVRTAFGLGLKEAKDKVDAHVAADPVLRADLEDTVKRARPGAMIWLLLLIVAGLAAFLLAR